MRTRAHAPKRRRQTALIQSMPLLAELGRLVLLLRDRPTPMQWLAAGVRLAALGVVAHAELRSLQAPSPWRYFDAEGPDDEWIEVPPEFRGLVLGHAVDMQFDETHWDGEAGSDRIVLARIEGYPVGWLQSPSAQLVDGPYVQRRTEAEIYAALGRAAWQRLGTTRVAYGSDGLARDPFLASAGPVSAHTRALIERMAAFRQQGLARSVLLVGPPGTGKSHAIRTIASALGVTTLRVELGALLDRHARTRGEPDAGTSLDTLTKMMDPRTLVLDDIDRVGQDARLLRFLEQASAAGRFVLASANCTEKMIEALLRPGRFDEIVTFDRLDPDLLVHLLGPDADLAPELGGLPIAYVREFVARVRVLGREKALAELEHLRARAADCSG
jgi:hypothetical protein